MEQTYISLQQTFTATYFKNDHDGCPMYHITRNDTRIGTLYTRDGSLTTTTIGVRLSGEQIFELAALIRCLAKLYLDSI